MIPETPEWFSRVLKIPFVTHLSSSLQALLEVDAKEGNVILGKKFLSIVMGSLANSFSTWESKKDTAYPKGFQNLYESRKSNFFNISSKKPALNFQVDIGSAISDVGLCLIRASKYFFSFFSAFTQASAGSTAN